MEKLGKINVPLLLIVAYLLKILIAYKTQSYTDAAILLVLTINYLGSRYFKVKESVITENRFREQVNADMSDVKQMMSAIKSQKMGNILKPGR